jgi:hypothetical protein
MRYTLVLLFFFIASCNVSQVRKENKSFKHLNKALKLSEKTTAEFTRLRFPCITTVRDTVEIWRDTTVYVDAPVYYTDTIRELIPGELRTVRVPVTMPAKTIYITKNVEDSAKIKLVTIDRDIKVADANSKADAATAQAERTQTRLDWWKRIALWAIVLLLITWAFIFLNNKTKWI